MLFHSLKATREQNHWNSCYKEKPVESVTTFFLLFSNVMIEGITTLTFLRGKSVSSQG